MKTMRLIILWGAIGTSVLFAQESPPLRRDVLGVDLKMSQADVRKRLTEIGTFVREERKRQEIWTVRDETFSHVAIGFDKEDHLRYVTAVARADEKAKRMGYDEIGALADAKQAGDPAIKNFNYVWTVPAKDGAPEMQVIARGRDPAFLDTFSLKQIDAEPASGEKDDD